MHRLHVKTEKANRFLFSGKVGLKNHIIGAFGIQGTQI